MKRIGILGGTFNPVHLEHVSLAKSAIAELKLDKLMIMPTYISPHKNIQPASATDRLSMLRIAFSGIEKVEVSDYEIEKQGKSYTYQTVEHFNKDKDIELFFIVGGDMLTDFKNWRNPERILSFCTLAVFSRQGFETDFQGESQYFKEHFNKQFIKLSYIGKDFSSTKIRTYAKFNLSLDGLIDDGVLKYITENAVYKPDRFEQIILKTLPEKRIKHTADVIVCALQRAREFNLDSEKVRIACTLHDIAKYLDYKTIEGFNADDLPAPVIHAFLGAYIAEKYLKIEDEEIIDAIRYHTTAKENMSDLAKLVFVADMVEEGRNYEGVDKLREIYKNLDLNTAFIECLKEEFLHLVNKKQNIYFETINAFNFYIK